ncbi:MAG: ROK family protein [Acidimicrobiales bacterium]|nr:ROK family protein [Acidimicrobiales bacterium]
MARALGIDIGGSGIKGAIVEARSGRLVSERERIPTPQPATVDAVVAVVAEIVDDEGWAGPVGVTFPGVVTGGVVRTAANLDDSWIGVDAAARFAAASGRPTAVLNDADAAGLAEVRFGAGRGVTGTVLVLTFGTGIGSALFHDGRLVPNTELGHIEVRGVDGESRAAASVRERKQLSWGKWSKRVSEYLRAVEDLVWPDLVIAGGGVSKRFEKWGPRLECRSTVVPATLQNQAGLVGAALRAPQPRRAPATRTR